MNFVQRTIQSDEVLHIKSKSRPARLRKPFVNPLALKVFTEFLLDTSWAARLQLFMNGDRMAACGCEQSVETWQCLPSQDALPPEYSAVRRKRDLIITG